MFIVNRIDRITRKDVVAVLLSGAAILVTTSAQAQTPPAQSGVESGLLVDQVTTKGLPIGSFNFNSGLSISESFDDNIYATNSNRISDLITTTSPFISLRSAWTSSMLNFRASGDFGRYAEHPDENYDDYRLSSDGRLDLTKSLNLFGGVSFAHLHESRESPDNVEGVLPTSYEDLEGHLGMEKNFGRYFLRFGGTFEGLKYTNVPSSTGFINNNDRDRNIYGLGGRAGMTIDDGYQFFVQATHNWREYRIHPDDFGFNRGSSGNEAAVGVSKQGAGAVSGELYLGYLDQTYIDPRLGSFSAPDFGGDLTYRISPVTSLTMFISRSVVESDLAGIAGFLETTGGLQLDHELQRNLTMRLDASYSNDEFAGTTRLDEVMTLGTGLRYFLLPQVFVDADYRYQRRGSTVSTWDYDDNQFMLKLGVQLARGYADDAVEPPQNEGLYVGALMNLGELSSNVVGPRGSGSLDGNFGSSGVGGALLGGYGAIINHWYLGAEFEARKNGVEWNHVHTNGRVFSVDEGSSIGINGRLGYVLDDGSMVYGLVGATRTELNTSYEIGGTQFHVTPMETGFRLGGGIESPLAGRLFLRMQYVHTEYNDYDVAIPSGTDTFGARDDTVDVGLVYRFFDRPSSENATPVPASRFHGFYGGAAFGYGSIDSANVGPREGGTTLIADRGGDGPGGGIFGGYGTTFHRFYLGAEIDGGPNGETWLNKRDPSGRDYGVNKVATIGVSARIGYVLEAGTLIYGRVGPTMAFYDTKNNVGTGFVDQGNTQLGLSVGFGVEAPINDRFFLRGEYRYDLYYGTYSVTSEGSAEQFRNNDNQFSIGLGYRF